MVSKVRNCTLKQREAQQKRVGKIADPQQVSQNQAPKLPFDISQAGG